MVCWGKPTDASHADQYVDCVAYGGYHGTGVAAIPTFAGTASALAPGEGTTMSLTRISHTHDNATDFALGAPSATNNAGGCFGGGCSVTTTTTPGATTTLHGTTTTTLPGGLVRTSVLGGGPAKSDCYVELGVTGTSGIAVLSSHIVSCRDGDAACDTDGVANGTCVFTVAVCANQTNVTGCSSTSLTGPPTVKVIPPGAGTLTPPDGTTTACGTSSTITIPLKGKTKNKPNKVKIRVKGKISSGKPKADSDTYILKCTPPAP